MKELDEKIVTIFTFSNNTANETDINISYLYFDELSFIF